MTLKLSRDSQILLKYSLDRGLSVFLVILLLPILVIISILIKLDDGGPIFFRQMRPGWHEKHFLIWKFRTMVPGADRHLDARGHVMKHVNRITRIGKFLRCFSLDELPQIINIVKGEMSFIGPRPALIEHLERYTPAQRQRFLMKPGITGLAQVNGRNKLTWSKRIEFDREYIQKYSLWLDIRIFIKTIPVVILRQGTVLDRNPEFADDLEPAEASPINKTDGED